MLSGSSKSSTRACAPRDRAVRAPVLDRHAVDQHPMDGAVALDQRRRIGARELAEGIVERLGGNVGIEPRERLAQPPLQHHVAVVRSRARRRLAGRDLRAVQDRRSRALSSQARAASSTTDSVKPLIVGGYQAD